jgi:Lysyl oxidase
MRRYVLLAGTTVAVIAACVAVEKPTVANHEHASSTPLFTHVNDPSRVDTGGGRLPDLIVESKATQNSWRVKEEFLSGVLCSVEEGNVTPGTRRLIRFTVTTPNQGQADVFVGSPLKHMDPNGDGDFSDQDGMFEFATCHDHYHFKHYATYRLISATTRKVWRAAKRGFCMLDTDPANTQTGDGNRNYLSCGTKSIDGFQGISHGWADSYVWQLAGQYFVLDGGDGQDAVPPGTYVIEITVNPPYDPPAGGCPLVTDPKTGLCHQFAESDYTNNVGQALISIPDHLGRDGYGPLKGTADPTAADEMRKPW